METQEKTDKLVVHAERAEQGLKALDIPEAGAELEVLQAAVVHYDHAKNEAAKADASDKAKAAQTQAEATLEEVLAVVPFSVGELDPDHLKALPPAADYVHTGKPYYARQLLPVLMAGGKGSQLVARLVERALEQSDKAEAHAKSVAAHDGKARDRATAARKELTAAIYKAEAFIHLSAPEGHAARDHIKRPRKANSAPRKDKGTTRGTTGSTTESTSSTPGPVAATG